MNAAPRKAGAHAVTGLVLLLMMLGIYAASQRVQYNWNWSAVPRYLFDLRGDLVEAPFDGTVEVSAGQRTLTLTSLDGHEQQRLEVARPFVDTGDPVFAGDALGRANDAAPGAGSALSRAWTFLRRVRPGPLLVGLGLTLEISLYSLIGSLILGLLFGLARVAKNAVARDLASVYVELIRGTPLLVQIFIVYFFIGTVLHLSAFTAGVAALTVFTGAYVAEIVRAGIQAVPKGQTEAAESLGLSGFQTMRHVILPQATRRVLPPLAGQFINLIKDSSLVSVMALTDLTKAGREIVGSTFSAFEVWFTVAAMYLLLTGGLSFAVQRLERRLNRHD